MKKTISILISLFFILLSCKQNDNKKNVTLENKISVLQNSENNLNDLLGNWEIKSNTENSNTFSLILLKNPKGSLEGFYCAVVRNGNKIDCSPNKEINIKEIKKQNNEYLVSFKSFFGAVNGEAKISLINGKLHWQVIKKPIGEFYCPLDVYLIKKDNDGTSSNNAGKINLNDENYKGEDITMQVYKDIIEYYGCGDYSVNGISLGKYNDFDIFIVENNCGDYPFKDLISVQNGKIADKLLIESSSFDIEKSEIHNIKDQTDFTFDIINFSNIQVKENHTINNKVQSNKVKKYFLDNNGKFLEK